VEQVNIKRSPDRGAYILSVFSIVFTILCAIAIIYFVDEVRELQQYGYLGVFFISLIGGATAIIPVPMLAILFALGGVMHYPWLVGLISALGELIGSLTIYFTGLGAGKAIKHTRLQSAYDRMLGLMARRGSLTLFLVASVLNPFFYPAALAAGAVRFGLKKYVFIVLLGKTIKNLTVVYAGYWGLKGLFALIGIKL
jgi:membrane protein YqaA with SNARE-associated domain